MQTEALPLAGVTVVDLTHVWSGPMGTRALAGLGAQVIKVESPAKPDALRGSAGDIRSRYPEFEPGADAINRNAWFNTQNVDKKDIVVDLKDPRGINLIYRLVELADLVIANYRPGVLDRMGLGYDRLKQANERIVLVEMPGYTADSPLASAPAFGAQFDAQSGSASLTGSPEAPLLTGFALGDPVAGLVAASAALAAIFRAKRSGVGAHLVLAQSEAMMPLFGEYFLAESVGDPLHEGVNADHRFVPHGIFSCADGSWVSVAVRSDDQWRSLAAVLQAAGQVVESDATRERRNECRDSIAAALTAYCARANDAATVASQLQEIGVPAGAVQGAKALSDDPHLVHHGVLRELNHPAAGRHRYQTLPTLIDGHRMGARTAAPTYGADTRKVLVEIAGLHSSEVDELVASRVCIDNELTAIPRH